MRIISGKYGGRSIDAPPTLGTRPTTDRVRESLFSILESRFAFDGAKVLDLFAGSGALGIEALSRGAAYCHFNDFSNAAILAIKRNLQDIKVPSACYNLTKLNATKKSFTPSNKFDLVLLDPPYNFEDEAIEQIIDNLFSNDLLADGAIIVLESANERKITNKSLGQIISRKYGSTYLQILLKTA